MLISLDPLTPCMLTIHMMKKMLIKSLITVLLVAAYHHQTDAFVVKQQSPSKTFVSKTTRLFAAPTTSNDNSNKTPIHLLAGFLGSGKTTVLQHLLENTNNAKIGVIVNDVASVNIDAKLVSKTMEGGIIQLENGCACCSLAGEFVDSVEQLMNVDTVFDAVVVELSGVADPTAVKNTWRDAIQSGHPVSDRAVLQNVITVVDSTTFGTDYLTWDFARDRDGWISEQEKKDCSGNQKVSMLLAEQVEAADVIVVNKLDLAGEDEVTVAVRMAASLNEEAVLVKTEHGKIDPDVILKDYGIVDAAVECDDADCTDKSHDHGHNHDCVDSDCTDTSHSHGHDHDCADSDCADTSHSHGHDHDCDDTDCTDTSHSHGHDHASDDSACTDKDCTDTSHSHAHDHDCEDVTCTDTSHSHSHDHDCDDADCTDTSHSHSHDHDCDDADCTDTSHSHSHDHQAATSTDSLGITNFVYKSTLPFDATKIQKLLIQWPISVKNVLDLETLTTSSEKEPTSNNDSNPFDGLLRSKGFCWFAPTAWDGLLMDPWRHDTAMYWTHAGKHMDIQEAGRWWSSISDDAMVDFFKDNPKEYERIQKEDFVTTEFGDRRQEIVFIGVDLDHDEITRVLDDCLLSEDDMEEYREKLGLLQEAMRVQVAAAA